MLERSYTTAITKNIKELGLSSSWVLHLGRGITPSALELEELGGLDKRAIGNCDTDAYGRHYDTKLPLRAMRVILGHNSRRVYFNHPHSVFYGDATHAHRTSLLFPWADESIEKVWSTDNYIAFGFLALVKILRWVIFQDAAVMIRQYNCTHYIYKQFDKVFESDAFNNYADQMVEHLKLSEKTDPNKLGVLTKIGIPYVNNNIENMNGSI